MAAGDCHESHPSAAPIERSPRTLPASRLPTDAFAAVNFRSKEDGKAVAYYSQDFRWEDLRSEVESNAVQCHVVHSSQESGASIGPVNCAASKQRSRENGSEAVDSAEQLSRSVHGASQDERRGLNGASPGESRGVNRASQSESRGVDGASQSECTKGQSGETVPEGRAWEAFHTRHTTAQFFKERRYLLEEFPELKSGPLKILEVGCGSGSSVVPLLTQNPETLVHACDCSPAAVRHATAAVQRALGTAEAGRRFKGFCWDAALDPWPLDDLPRDGELAESASNQGGEQLGGDQERKSPERGEEKSIKGGRGREAEMKDGWESGGRESMQERKARPENGSGPGGRKSRESMHREGRTVSNVGSLGSDVEERVDQGGTHDEIDCTIAEAASLDECVHSSHRLGSSRLEPTAPPSRVGGAEGNGVISNVSEPRSGTGSYGGTEGGIGMSSSLASVHAGLFDFVTLVFTLSAVHPAQMLSLLSRLHQRLRPGGSILFRDYGLYDMTMLRFPANQRVGDRLYRRLDGTLSYFFSKEALLQLAGQAGFSVVDCEYCCVNLVNKRKKIQMRRVWLHARLQKPCNIAHECKSAHTSGTPQESLQL